MDLADYKQKNGDDPEAATGWDAIDSRLETVYPRQEPKHWGTIVKHMVGGPDPLDGISAYECRDGGTDHLHFITYGYSSLYYDEESVGAEHSKFGFEMTFRLATALPPAEQPAWVINLLQNLARYVFNSGNRFSNYHWIPANGPIRAGHDTDIVGLAFVHDPVLRAIDSPHGCVEFIQAFGLTHAEVDALKAKTHSCSEVVEQHRLTNPLLITNIERTCA